MSCKKLDRIGKQTNIILLQMVLKWVDGKATSTAKTVQSINCKSTRVIGTKKRTANRHLVFFSSGKTRRGRKE